MCQFVVREPTSRWKKRMVDLHGKNEMNDEKYFIIPFP